jgi:hypothetical protein
MRSIPPYKGEHDMAKRIQVWPPGGGDPITVYELDAGRLIMNGWTTEPAKAKPKAKSKDQAATSKAEEAN